ncbi:hypothetical protein BDP55DRAFT_634198 [Colletotrichum godetiae]|uniref:Uncharacterized protein n=1 Tax=Colletotrichum godetiae TaxID=1209918 RepID=A0AAJ0EVH1_9PEZI|nr:uncharacterized protein BDP55DRAFT_634198 [Colletotrichum godetiae]KAK1673255.1 hypothetical protein BDP55DRAFT_634198 [Colletotrichum godetiae]
MSSSPQRGISRVLPQVMIPSCQGSDEPRGRLSPEKTSTAGTRVLLGMEAKGPRLTIEWMLGSQAMIVARNSKVVPYGVRSAPAKSRDKLESMERFLRPAPASLVEYADGETDGSRLPSSDFFSVGVPHTPIPSSSSNRSTAQASPNWPVLRDHKILVWMVDVAWEWRR